MVNNVNITFQVIGSLEWYSMRWLLVQGRKDGLFLPLRRKLDSAPGMFGVKSNPEVTIAKYISLERNTFGISHKNINSFFRKHESLILVT